MNEYQTTPRIAKMRPGGSGCLILALIVSLVPALAPQLAGAGLWGTGYLIPMAEDIPATYSEIRHPISDLRIGLWFEGVPAADLDNLRWNEIDDPSSAHDGDTTYIVTTAIKSYRAGIAAPTVPTDATNISVSVVWTVRFEVEDSFHVAWSNLGVNGEYYFGPMRTRGTTYETYTDTWTNDPSTGLEWTPATANTAMGLGFDSNVESPVHVTRAYIQIDYEIDSSAPSINVEKYVWDGTAWVDADTAPGPYLLPGTDPQFKFVVANVGNVDLGNVDLADNVYGAISLDGTLAAGSSAEYFLTGTWAAGQHTNTATASGDYDGDTYTGSDDANYFGVPPAPAIDVEKYVWDGTAWVDADTGPGPSLPPGTDPQFRFVVTNGGNVDLSDVDLTDNVYGAIVLDGTLAAGGSAEYLFTGTWAAGQHTNTATATGDYDGNGYTDSDDANYLGAVAASIDLEKFVWDGTAWVDADTGPGPTVPWGTDPLFKFVVTNDGNVTLSSTRLGDLPVIASFYAEQELATPCVTPTHLDPQATFTCFGSLPWAKGTQTDTGTATGDYGGSTYTDSDAANFFGAWALCLPSVLGQHTVSGRATVDYNQPGR